MDRDIVVIGMGYVGIPCAALLADVPGHRVTGVQRRSRRSGWKIDCLNNGCCPFAGDEPGLGELIRRVVVQKESFRVSDDYSVCQHADAILIDVQTPTDQKHVPQYDSLRQVAVEVGRYLKPDTVVIVESTVAPGTTQNVLLPILEKESGLTGGEDFSLAFSYERVMPGKLLDYIVNFPRVVGGINAKSTEEAVALYQTIVREEIKGTDALTAEMSKVVENAYRDVNIAFANEVALLSESLGVDVFEIRNLINARPDRNMHIPGAGVGGHCLPKDSWLLQYGVRTYGKSQSEMRLIPLAREINDGMPSHMFGLIEQGLQSKDVSLEGARVAILGVSYLENADDTRNTPAAALAKLLRDQHVRVIAHDPHVRVVDWKRALGEGHSVPLTPDLDEALADADCAVVVTKHREYFELTPETLRSTMRTLVLVDGRNVVDLQEDDIVVRAVGKGTIPRSPP